VLREVVESRTSLYQTLVKLEIIAYPFVEQRGGNSLEKSLSHCRIIKPVRILRFRDSFILFATPA